MAAADDVRPPPLRARAPSIHDAPTARRVRSSPDLLPELSLPPPSPARSAEAAPPVGPTRPRASTQTEIFGLQSLPLEVQEQLFGILKATLDASMTPLLDKQTALERRLDVLREAEERAAVAAAARLASPPPRRSAAPQGAAAPPQVSLGPTVGASTRPPMISTSYGLVIEAPRGSRRPPIEIALEKVGPIEVPDFGSSRRAAGRVFVALLFAGVIAAIVATLLSYT